MYCLHCGDCCKRMSPISTPDPCPYIVEIDGFIFCGDYEHRPEECSNHFFPMRFCPIGMDVLKLQSLDEVRIRIDKGYEYIKRGI